MDWLPLLFLLMYILGIVSTIYLKSIWVIFFRNDPPQTSQAGWNPNHRDPSAWESIETLTYSTNVPMSWAVEKDGDFLLKLIAKCLEFQEAPAFSVKAGRYDVEIEVKATFKEFAAPQADDHQE